MGRWLLIASLVPLTAGAADPVELPPVDVPMPPEEAKPTPHSPSRRDPAGTVTTVEVEEHAGEAKDTAALLTPTPGIVLSSAGPGQAATLSVRGAASSGTLVLLD